MILSVCMMIKNEEKHLDACLSALNDLKSKIDMEIIVVDTGSTDKSVEIAKKYTDKVYFHEWNNNFSEMRNITFSYAKGKWILILDGDEVLESTYEIEKFFSSGIYKHFNAASIIVKNLSDESNLELYSPLRSIRLCNNSDGSVKYKGVVHNQLIHKNPTVELQDSLLHYGYVTTDRELMKTKFDRTASLLIKELEKEPENIYYNYQLAVSYAMYGKTKQGVPYIEKALELCKNENSNFEQYRYVLLFYAKIGIAINAFDMVISISELLESYCADYLDAQFYLGFAYMKTNKLEQSVEHYRQYLSLLSQGKKLKTLKDTSIVTYSLSEEPTVRKFLGILLLKLGEDEAGLKECLIYDEMGNDGYLVSEIIAIANKTKKYKIINDMYLKYHRQTEKIKLQLEALIENFYNQSRDEAFRSEMSKGASEYNFLYRVRSHDYQPDEFGVLIKKIDFEKAGDYYADVLYSELENKIVIEKMLAFGADDQIRFIEYMQNKYASYGSKISKIIVQITEEINISFEALWLYIRLLRPIVQKKLISGSRYFEIIDLYMNLGIISLSQKYTTSFIESAVDAQFLEEEIFFKHYFNALEEFKFSRLSYMSKLRNMISLAPNQEVIVHLIGAVETVRNLEDIEKDIESIIQAKDWGKLEKIEMELLGFTYYSEKIYLLLSLIYFEFNDVANANRILLEGVRHYPESFAIYEYLKMIYEVLDSKGLSELAAYFSKLYNEEIKIESIEVEPWIEEFLEQNHYDSKECAEKFIEKTLMV